jgi:hypothetical protein
MPIDDAVRFELRNNDGLKVYLQSDNPNMLVPNEFP